MGFPARHSSAQKVGLLVEVLTSYLLTQWWLRRRGLPAAVALARGDRREHADAAELAAHAYALRLGGVVRRVLAPFPTDTRCLARSLVLLRLLARRGMRTSLVLGVASDPEFSAHAWVEHDSCPLLPAGGGRFQQLTQL